MRTEAEKSGCTSAERNGGRNMAHYDYLLVGAGLYNGTVAHFLTRAGKKCLVIEKRDHIGGNIYCEETEGIHVHKYGAHIFHTSDKDIWNFVNSFVEFNRFTNSPVANYKGEMYNLPFNMNTFREMWNIRTPDEAKAIIDRQRSVITGEPKNLEEQAISLVGTDIYTKLIKGYTEKQWGRDCRDLPAFIIKRLPVRFIYDNNYFNDRYQGIPEGGYNVLIEKLFAGCDVETGVDFLSRRDAYVKKADHVIYTGPIDAYFDYSLGNLQYRSLKFETEVLDRENYQGVAVVNYTERDIPYTRIIEHKHFEFGTQKKTVITREYPEEWKPGMEPYYPVNDEKNQKLFLKYRTLGEKADVIFGGRLGEYKYYDMDKVIGSAMKKVTELLK
jgi:UDP-galactopyranose mutase